MGYVFMTKKIKVLMIIVILIILFIIGFIVINKINIVEKKETKLQQETDITVVPTMEDIITSDSSWCGTFQLVWNDMKNEVAKKDIIFTPQLEVVENLNKETFTQNNLSEQSYYKKFGIPSPKLKKEIESSIKKKFNETSDILEDFEWNSADSRDYVLYTMLKKEFQFQKAFEQLENGTFRNYENVKYFGIEKDSKSDQLRNQVIVLYYNSKDEFAIKLKTKQLDEVILCKSPKGDTFNEIYQDIIKQESQYNGNTSLQKGELLKVPNITFNTKKEFKEIENKTFLSSNGDECYIKKAVQTIDFELDRTGGKIKSEAGGIITNAALAIVENREFAIDNTFAIFLREKGKDMPYFAGRIDDITKFQ